MAEQGHHYKKIKLRDNARAHLGDNIYHSQDILQLLPCPPRAVFNASGKDNDPLYLSNTRVDILQQIRTWADGYSGKYIFWLSGWAGTGKSTIARTIAREYYDKGCLEANFFFSRGGEDVSHTGKFVSSLALQLAQRCPAFGDLIYKAISNNRGIVNKMLKDQWKELILDPLSKLDAKSIRALLILVMDALDKCDEENGIQNKVQLLKSAQVLQKVWFRILVTSRPVIPIRYSFYQLPDGEYQDFVLHNISQDIVDHDIFVFLQRDLETVAQKLGLGRDWSGGQDIKRLVCKAAGSFIWVATAYRFISKGGQFASERLSSIFQDYCSVTEPDGELNKIYIKALENSVSPNLKEEEKENLYTTLREALGAIVLLFSPLSPSSLARLLQRPKVKVDAILGDLHSILDVPMDPSCPIVYTTLRFGLPS